MELVQCHVALGSVTGVTARHDVRLRVSFRWIDSIQPVVRQRSVTTIPRPHLVGGGCPAVVALLLHEFFKPGACDAEPEASALGLGFVSSKHLAQSCLPFGEGSLFGAFCRKLTCETTTTLSRTLYQQAPESFLLASALAPTSPTCSSSRIRTGNTLQNRQPAEPSPYQISNPATPLLRGLLSVIAATADHQTPRQSLCCHVLRRPAHTDTASRCALFWKVPSPRRRDARKSVQRDRVQQASGRACLML